MSSSQKPSNLELFLHQLKNVSDVEQLAHGLKSEPQMMFEAIKLLAHQYEQSSDQEVKLDIANHRIRELEHAVSQSQSQNRKNNNDEVLSRLTDILTARQTPTVKTPIIPDSPVFSGEKKDFLTWKNSSPSQVNNQRRPLPERTI
ncbi:hypothetical protein HI914_05441 [Erysiphe necator]|nr:hypothetical protein HI914_05441 [Erysiphe necator]